MKKSSLESVFCVILLQYKTVRRAFIVIVVFAVVVYGVSFCLK